MVDISVLGISLQEEGGSPLLLLHPHGTQSVLTLNIGPMEAFAISLALHGKPEQGKRPDSLFPRPMTHDLMFNIILALNAKLVSINLIAVVDGAYIAEAVLAHPGGEAVIDCRPSDGVALALRCGAGIRAAESVVGHARNIDDVMAELPEHVRAIAAAKLAALPQEGAPGRAPRIPRAVEDALAAKQAITGRDPRQELISVAQKMIIEERAKGREEISAGLEQLLAVLDRRPPAGAPGFPVSSGGDAVIPPISDRTLRVKPQIRVSFVRQTSDGKKEVLDEFSVSRNSIPDDVLVGLGLSPRETEAVQSAPEDDKWAVLLRILAPETKVPM